MITSIIKLLIISIGLVSTIWFAVSGLRGNMTGYKRAGFSLILTFLLVSVISIIEQRVYSSKLKKEETEIKSK